MDIKQIKDMMAAMEKAGLKKMRIKEKDGFELELERGGDVVHFPPPKHHEPHHHHHFAPSSAPPRGAAEEPKSAPAGEFVSSPMVGTFYSAPSPEDAIYAKVGDTVDEETVVCIIEAMKVMNEVKAGKKGKIAEVLVQNGEPVEFGTHLFRIEP